MANARKTPKRIGMKNAVIRESLLIMSNEKLEIKNTKDLTKKKHSTQIIIIHEIKNDKKNVK